MAKRKQPAKRKPETGSAVKLEPAAPSWREHLSSVRTFVEAEPAPLADVPEERRHEIPEDTLRRLRYPVIETIHPDGTRSFKHDPQIRDDARIASRR